MREKNTSQAVVTYSTISNNAKIVSKFRVNLN